MNIVVYEREHFEIIGAIVQVLATGAHQVHLLLPRWMKDSLAGLPEGPKVHFLPEEPAQHPKAVERLCRETTAGLLVLGTVSFRHWQFASVCRNGPPRMKTLLYVHDIRDLLEPRTGSGLRGWARYFGKLRLRRAVSGYAVLLEEMRAYLGEHDKTRKPVWVIPGAFYRSTEAPAVEGERLILAVPGSIDSLRRNYDDVNDFASKLVRESAGNGFEIRLLGSVTAHKPCWIGSFPDLVIHKDEGLPQEEFDRWMSECEIVWIPLQPVFQRDDHPAEYYGVTKSSGAFFDALRHGKPLLVPDALPAPGILASALLRYSDATYLYYLLQALKQNPPARRRLGELAREQSEKVRVADVRARLRSLIGNGT